MRGFFGSRQRREPDLIETLCHRSGQWAVTATELDIHQVRSIHRYRVAHLQVRHMEGQESLIFQLFFRLRFSLENPPSGLFARLLLRNFELHYACWVMNLVERCEAGIQVTARLPADGITVSRFHGVCTEMADEAESFDQELAEKFHYGVTPARPTLPPHTCYGTFGQTESDIRYIESIQHQQPEPISRYRLSDLRGDKP